MSFHDHLKSAIDYIDANLDGDIDFDIAAQKACCSTYHFQRMFSYIAGVPLSEYIRCRRMTFAAIELQISDVKIVDLAIKYGYDSASSFTRAFHSFHGLTPSSARDAGTVVKAYPKVSFQLIATGVMECLQILERHPYASFSAIAVSKMLTIALLSLRFCPCFA